MLIRSKASFLSLFFLLLIACGAEKNSEKPSNLISINPDDDYNEIIRKTTLVVPTRQQYKWQQLEFIAFLHFGPNTFSAVEWGSGKEDPSVFNPTELDAGQWISVIKDAGMKLAMITAKHHDGFCLWPTTTTPHSVKNSPWKDGKGDVLGELVQAARKEGIKIGVYLSPADLSEIEREGGTYGNGSKPKIVKIPSDPELQKKADKVYEYELDDYNALFMNQLYEVLSQYGDVMEVWFDGANPKPGTGQTYDRAAWNDLIRKLQPDALIAIKGPDVRWCGNEAGHTRANEWSVLPVPVNPESYNWPDLMADDLGSRDKLKDSKFLYWYPAETNTSIRRGWFYRDEKQYVKTIEEIVDAWYRTVGGNSVFLLNLTPDRRGLIPDKDANTLREVGKIISNSFKENLAKSARASSSNEDSGAKANFVLDGNDETYWKPTDGSESADLVVTLNGEKEFNRLVLQECIKTQGQRIEQFAFDIWINGKWEEITTGTVVGYKNIRRFPLVKTEKVRLRILASRVAPTISSFELYKAPEMLTNPKIARNKQGYVSISCQSPDPKIFYTLDGTAPDLTSAQYKQPFLLPDGGEVKAIATINNGKEKSEVVVARMDKCAAKWKVNSVTSSQKGYEGEKAIDGNPNTMWHTPWDDNSPKHPHSIEIDLGELLVIKGFSYTPRANGLGGICKDYKLETSVDGVQWQVATKGTFDNIRNNPVHQEVDFGRSVEAKYIRFTSLSNVNNDEPLSIAEIGIITF
uniref:alpha-L-fucosidase n=1 Tax=uncultured Draconibacterium sp. TaxID=1573823 RepID=UPI0032179E9B